MTLATLLGLIDLTAGLFWALRVAAGVGGALVVQVVTVTSPPRPGVSGTVLGGLAG